VCVGVCVGVGVCVYVLTMVCLQYFGRVPVVCVMFDKRFDLFIG